LTWFATTGYGNTTAANDGSFLSESQRLGDWVSDKYECLLVQFQVLDTTLKFMIKIQILSQKLTHQIGYLTIKLEFLVFNNASTTYGAVSTSGPFRIVGYRYIGSKGIIPAYYGGSGFTTYTKGDILVCELVLHLSN